MEPITVARLLMMVEPLHQPLDTTPIADRSQASGCGATAGELARVAPGHVAGNFAGGGTFRLLSVVHSDDAASSAAVLQTV